MKNIFGIADSGFLSHRMGLEINVNYNALFQVNICGINYNK